MWIQKGFQTGKSSVNCILQESGSNNGDFYDWPHQMVLSLLNGIVFFEPYVNGYFEPFCSTAIFIYVLTMQ